MKAAIFIVFLRAFIWGSTFEVKCIGVTDGDTMKVLLGNKIIKIRLEGIDCPEIGQDFGTEARKFTSAMVFGKMIYIFPKEKDQYGRLLASVVVDGLDLAKELLRQGLAWHYKINNQDPVLARLQKEARGKRVGLWHGKNPMPPWEWRKARRGKNR